MLNYERAWQVNPSPKLVSSYFGGSGRFAYDETGEYVVVQGHAWLWKGKKIENLEDDIESDNNFYDTLLPWAYLAIFNSQVFESLLSLSCPTVQGGQLDLSNRFVDQVFIPDLSNEGSFPRDVVKELASYGQQIHKGKDLALENVNRSVSKVYGFSADWLKP